MTRATHWLWPFYPQERAFDYFGLGGNLLFKNSFLVYRNRKGRSYSHYHHPIKMAWEVESEGVDSEAAADELEETDTPEEDLEEDI